MNEFIKYWEEVTQRIQKENQEKLKKDIDNKEKQWYNKIVK